MGLRKGSSRSCGCLRREQVRARNTTHGGTDSYTYGKWRSMWSRVRNAHRPENRCYKGVDVCDDWKDYKRFLQDMGPCKEGYSLDRLDNSLGYSPSNCIWVPLLKQAVNTRRLIHYIHDGKYLHISEIARQIGVNPNLIYDRIKLGWSLKDAVSTNKKKRSPSLTPTQIIEVKNLVKAGKSQTSIAKLYGVTQACISITLKRHARSDCN